MEIKKEKNVTVAKFVTGDVLTNFQALMDQCHLDSALVLTGIGMLKNATIGYFDGEKYREEHMKNPVELISMQGNIARDEKSGTIVCHLHVALADHTHMVKGGHLLKGEVEVVNEIVVHHLEKIKILRKKNPKGLLEMTLSSSSP